MNISSKKTAIVLIGILSVCLAAGNVLFAGDRGNSTPGLIDAEDVSFVSGAFTESSVSNGNPDARSFTGVIGAEDAAVAAEPFNRALIASGPSGNGSSQSVVTASDIGFVRNGTIGSDFSGLVCVVDGAQVTGSRCAVN